MTKRVVGFVLLFAGLALLLMDAHVAYLTQSAAHGLNIGAGLLLIFGGLWSLMPVVAREFAKEILKVIPALGQLWPGGSRRTDPPPDPDIPPPPRESNR